MEGKHVGYANGAKKLTKEVIEAAIGRLLGENTREETKDKEGNTVIKLRHETDPPPNFLNPRMRKPGPLPTLIQIENIVAGNILTHEHTVRVANDDDLDVWAYHFARLVIVEARRIQGKFVAVKSVGDHPTEDGSLLVATVTVR